MKSQIRQILQHFQLTLRTHIKAIPFIVNNRLWHGFWQYGWVTKLLLFFGILAGLKFISVIINWLFAAPPSSDSAFMEMGILLSELGNVGYDFLFASSTKYLILILMEVLIFHASRTTIEIILQKKLPPPNLKVFIKAQIRMIKMAFYAFVMEAVFSVLIQAVLAIASVELIEPVLIFIVHCYFLGLVIIDNFYEQFGLGIRQSAKRARKYLGVGIAIGAILHLLLLIPLFGAVIGPLLASVVAAMVLYQVDISHNKEQLQENFGKQEAKLEMT